MKIARRVANVITEEALCAISLSFTPQTTLVRLTGAVGQVLEQQAITTGWNISFSAGGISIPAYSILTGIGYSDNTDDSQSVSASQEYLNPTELVIMGQSTNGNDAAVHIRIRELAVLTLTGAFQSEQFMVTQGSGFAKTLEFVDAPFQQSELDAGMSLFHQHAITPHWWWSNEFLSNSSWPDLVQDNRMLQANPTQRPLIDSLVFERHLRGLRFDGIDDLMFGNAGNWPAHDTWAVQFSVALSDVTDFTTRVIWTEGTHSVQARGHRIWADAGAGATADNSVYAQDIPIHGILWASVPDQQFYMYTKRAGESEPELDTVRSNYAVTALNGGTLLLGCSSSLLDFFYGIIGDLRIFLNITREQALASLKEADVI